MHCQDFSNQLNFLNKLQVFTFSDCWLFAMTLPNSLTIRNKIIGHAICTYRLELQSKICLLPFFKRLYKN